MGRTLLLPEVAMVMAEIMVTETVITAMGITHLIPVKGAEAQGRAAAFDRSAARDAGRSGIR